jgi:hypothetical protein
MIFVYVCSTWVIVELKTRFETCISRNDVNGVSLFNLSYVINLCSQRTTNAQIKFFMFDWSIYRLFVLNSGWKRVSLQIMIFVYVCSTCGIVEIKTLFETWITRNDVNGVGLFNLSFLIKVMAYLCPQRTPNIQIKYFMFHCSIYRLFVPNSSLETCSIVEIKTRFELWITRNDVNGVSLFHLSYLITLMVNLCSQWKLNVQINYFVFDWSMYRLFVLNTRLESWPFPNHDIPICLLDKKNSWTKNSFWNVNDKKWR